MVLGARHRLLQSESECLTCVYRHICGTEGSSRLPLYFTGRRGQKLVLACLVTTKSQCHTKILANDNGRKHMKMGCNISVSKKGGGNVHAAAYVGSVPPHQDNEEGGGFLFGYIDPISDDFSCFIGIDFS